MRHEDRAGRTENGKVIEVGLRVFTYDMRWGTVVELDVWPTNDDPWHRVRYDDGGEGTFNGQRMSTWPSADLRERFPDTKPAEPPYMGGEEADAILGRIEHFCSCEDSACETCGTPRDPSICRDEVADLAHAHAAGQKNGDSRLRRAARNLLAMAPASAPANAHLWDELRSALNESAG